MDLRQAYDILELPHDSKNEDTKKRYKEFTKKYHPDINKEPGAEEKFKKINEAYSFISNKDNKSTHDFSHIEIENVELYIEISFKEAVLGCKKNVKYNRKNKCDNCNGRGECIINNGCTKCSGKGKIVMQQGNMIMFKTCDKCLGKFDTQICTQCNQGVVETETSININIPGGIQNGNILRLSGMGNYVGQIYQNSFFSEMNQFTNVLVNIKVQPYFDLKIVDKDVVSEINISLLNALQGCQTKIHTIRGEKEINISSLTKNNDEISLPNLGVNGEGCHRVIVKVEYPNSEGITKLVEVLTGYEIH